MTALLLRVVLFVAFLLPITVGDISVNYTFLLYALFLLIQAKRLERPSNLLLGAIIAYSAIYLVGLGFDLFAPEAMLLRRGVSFAIFMSMFAFVLVPFGKLETRAFKIAIVSVSLAFSIYSIGRFYSVGGNGYGPALKDIVGSQRYGFVYLLAIFCLMTESSVDRRFQAGRAVALFVILAGLVMTFSRSSIVALGGVLPLFLLHPLVTGIGFTDKVAKTGRRIGLASLYVAALFVVFPVIFQFYGEVILSRYTPVLEETLDAREPPPERAGTEEISARDLVLIPEGSEGGRVVLWTRIISDTLAHPLTGSSYLGVWHLKDTNAGSAHSQYFDVLLRTGLFGTLLYIMIIGNVLFFLWRKEPGLFWGFLAMLIFGLFHETFKESQGAFILACLLGMYGAHRREIFRHRSNAATQVSSHA